MGHVIRSDERAFINRVEFGKEWEKSKWMTHNISENENLERNPILIVVISILFPVKVIQLVDKYSIDCDSDFVKAVLSKYHYMYTLSADILYALSHKESAFRTLRRIFKSCAAQLSSTDEELIKSSNFSWLAKLPQDMNRIELIKLSIKSHRVTVSYTCGSTKCRREMLRRLANSLNILTCQRLNQVLSSRCILEGRLFLLFLEDKQCQFLKM